MNAYYRLSEAIGWAGRYLKNTGYEIRTEQWQGVDTPAPMLETLEVSFRGQVNPIIHQLVDDVRPNLPWADLHFDERVGGVPSNPGEAYKSWPYFRGNARDEEFRHEEGHRFTHTYQERLWAGRIEGEPTTGIRYRLGDLSTLLDLLKREPLTRQAFLPIWFPEDTGAAHGGRVPCTLGYWFVCRHEAMHITYYIRSCDYFRHLRDDVYMAARLLLWVLDQLREGPENVDGFDWWDVEPGFLNMHIGSLHCWMNEKGILP